MKKLLISTSVAVLLASNSMVSFASSVTITNTFTSGTAAVAAEVNENFDDVATSVNDNDSRVTTNTGNISTNTGNISTNTGNISTNTGNITTNTGNITTNTGDIADNTTAIGNIGDCPSDMVAVGSLCVDMYEASVWDAATLGNQIIADGGGVDYPCFDDGRDCSATAANPIYARSVPSVEPAAFITHYQAAIACTNVGKRLPTTTEWLTAAAGTPLGNGTGTDSCNVPAGGGTVANTNASSGTTGCTSSAGAVDMVGNVAELSADLHYYVAGFGTTNTNSTTVVALGDDFQALGSASPQSMFYFTGDGTAGTGPEDAGNNSVGFRCVR